MRSIIVLLAALNLNLNLSAQITAAVNNLTSDSINPKVTELIYEHAKEFADSTQLSLALIVHGQVRFIGVERLEDTLNLIDNNDHVFEIGSISKVFTATLLSSAIRRSEVSLDDQLSDITPIDSSLQYEVTLAELANHTSGLPALPSNLNLFANPSNPYKSYRAIDLDTYLLEGITLVTSPGAEYAYSNLGVGLLGYLLSLRTGITYEEMLQDRICVKYGLRNTTSSRQSVPKGMLVHGRQPNGLISSNWDFDVLVGAGGILSNAKDMSKFALAHLNPDNLELSLTHGSTYKVNERMEIGLGWHIIIDEKSQRQLWHNGGTGGYTSSMTIDPRSSTGVVILSNISAYHFSRGAIDQLCFALMKHLNSN